MNKPSRILVCGGRDFTNDTLLFREMDKLVEFFADKFFIIEGGAQGADFHAGRWAQSKGIPFAVMPANWKFYDKAAGTIRNEWMVDWLLPDLCIAFPGGIGTQRMKDYCELMGVTVHEPL